MKGAILRGVVANIERKLLFIDLGGVLKRGGLQTQGALTDPVVLGHLLDEHGFGGSGGLMFVAQRFEQFLEFGGVFVGQEDPFAGEAVAQIVLRESGFACRCFWTGAVLSIGLIGTCE